ncbi:MAG: hypothetical protein GEU93_18140 [Propionibacteriales bacterium]|nr:hypothetical protein [Propionibacteriales bacterium]
MRRERGFVSEPNAGAPAPVARGPIRPPGPTRVEAGWEAGGQRRDGPVVLVDHTPLAKIQVKAAYDGEAARILGVPFGRAVRGGVGDLVVGSGPGEWLALGPPGTQHALRGRLDGALAPAAARELVTTVDLTHGRAMMRLTGARAAEVLTMLCAIDLDDRRTPDGTAFRSLVAHLATDVIRDDRDGMPSYLLHCETSSGQYLFDCVVDAGREFGLVVSGP